MATSFSIRTKKDKGRTNLHVRVQAPGINIRVATPLKTDIEHFLKRGDADAYKRYYSNLNAPEHKTYEIAQSIKKTIDDIVETERTITLEDVKGIVESLCYKEEREEEERRKAEDEGRRQKEAEANRMTLQKYLDTYIGRIESGDILTKSDKRFSPYTTKSLKYSIHVFNDFQAERGLLDFIDITSNTFDDYKKWMINRVVKDKKGYAEGAIGARVKDIKAILARAQSEGYHDNRSYEGIHVSKPIKDSIYLTEEELNAITNVNPKDFPDEFPNPDQAEQFRDVFLIGCYSGQRISDYGHIHRDDIFDAVINGTKRTYIRFRQQKTGKVVVIPCKPQLVELIKKYNYNLPQVKFEQMLNRTIKDIAKVAGITTPITATIVKGGKDVTNTNPKYKLVSSHTARRTFATLAYMNGMSEGEIMACTGHGTVKQLRTYIRADELDNIRKLVKNDFFNK